MRTYRFARLAAEAELLLIRREIRTAIRRGIYGGVAAVFAIGVLIGLHVLGFMALQQYGHFTPFIAMLIVLVVDALITLMFGLLAGGAMKDPVAEEARLLRDQSLVQAKESITMAAMLKPAGRLLGRKHIYGLVLAALTARFLGGRA